MRSSVLTIGCAALAVGLAACGSSATTTKTNGGSTPSAAIVRAADVTRAASGYRFKGTVKMTGPGTLTDTMSGTILRASNRGEINLRQNLGGHSMAIEERFSGRTFWISASGIQLASKLTSKPWLKYDIQSTLDQLGVGGLPSGSSDPGQFLSYLKAVGGSARKLGSQEIDGVRTTHYEATANLDRYPPTLPVRQRAQARKAVARLMSTIGSERLHMQVWIDDHNLTRRMALSMPECVRQQRLHLSMSMDMYDFGTQAKVTVPSASESYDITPLVDEALGDQKLGCTATS